MKAPTVIVPVSGGKDSQACLKLAVQAHGADNVLGVFCDTGFEHKLTYAHVEKMKRLYGVRIETIRGEGDVPTQIRKHGRFPSFQARFCTEELKIWPSKRFYTFVADLFQQGFEVWYGMRLDESDARAKRYSGQVGGELYAPHDIMAKYPKYLAKMGVMFRLAVLEWSTQDVLDFLAGEENPLYAAGFDRVGCFPCLAAGDAHKERAFAFDDFGREQRKVVRILEAETGKSVWTSKGGLARNTDPERPGCAICSM